jgi:1,2-diacylglycerol 3-alpha-glucosyltransferase
MSLSLIAKLAAPSTHVIPVQAEMTWHITVIQNRYAELSPPVSKASMSVRPLRILMISDVYFPRVNGVSTSIRTFRRELQAMGHHISLIAPGYPGHSAVEPDIIRIPSRGVPMDPEDRMMRRRDIEQLLPQLKQQRFDVLHIHTPFIAHYAGLYLAAALQIPVVESYHTFFEEYLYHYVPLLPRSLLRWLARRVTVSQCNAVQQVIAPSLAMQDALQDYGVRTAITILPTGLEASQFRLGDGARFRTKHGIAATRPTLLYVGRVAFEKNIDFLVHSFQRVHAAMPDALLMIVGEGPATAHLQALVAKLGLNSAVKFIGYLDRDSELLDCYRSGDLFVFASRTETQGLVLLEALAQGTPVISTMHMGTRDVLANTQGTRIVNEDLTEFSAACIELLQNTTARQSMAVVAPQDAQRWASSEMAGRVVRVYEELRGSVNSNSALLPVQSPSST